MYKIKRVSLYLVLYICLVITSCTSKQKETDLPNIIVFLVDDMGLMDTSVPFIIGANDEVKKYPLNDFYRTPNMEKLAKQGIRFTNFYAHSVCSPSRVSLLTGQNAARHRTTSWIKPEENNRTIYGPKDWNWKGLSRSSITLPRLLQDQGYKTIHVGKAHFGPIGSEGENPLNLGFDINIGGCSIGQPGSYLGTEGFGHLAGNSKRAVPDLEKYHGKDIFLTEALTLEANATISEAVKEDRPFFLNMSHYAVHTPFYSDSRFAAKYKNTGKSQKAQAYATLIEGIDKSLGDIIKHVNELGVGENTLLLFLGDNGSDAPLDIKDDYSSASPLKGKKGNHWEGGMRVPFIASWVNKNDKASCQKKLPIAQNGIQQQIGTLMDLFSTVSRLANIELPKDHEIDGFDLQTQFTGKRDQNRDAIFLNHYPHKHRSNYFTSLIVSNWKIIYHYQPEDKPRYEMFDLKTDPFEKTNLADTNPEQLLKMMHVLAEEMKDKNALYPEVDNKPLKLIIPN